MEMNYQEQLKDPRWQKKRLEIFARDEWICQSCFCDGLRDGKTLHVHHRTYVKGRAPWEYPDDNFVTYCEQCHVIETDDSKTLYPAYLEMVKSLKMIMLSGDIYHLFKVIKQLADKRLIIEPFASELIRFLFTDEVTHDLVKERYFKMLQDRQTKGANDGTAS